MLDIHKIKTIDFFAANPVFSLNQAQEELGAPRGRIGTVERLKYHLKAGHLVLVTRGVYAVVPRGALASNFQPDPFLVAAAIRPDAIFSYHCALELLGSSHSVLGRHTLFSGRQRMPLVLGNTTISVLHDPGPFQKAHPSRYLGTRKVEWRGRLLSVTGPERTLVEGLRRPGLCGGADELIQSAKGFAVLDMKMLDTILRCYDIANLYAAAGWFLERFGHAFHMPDSFLRELEKRTPKSPQYLEKGRRGGVFCKRWNIIIPESIPKGAANVEAQR
jgi:predicted transcriptional regulator of viral defense system